MLVWIVACTGDTDAPEPFDGTFTLTDDRNYTFSSALDIGCQEAPLGEDFEIEWGSLTTDMLGQPVVDGDVTTATLLAFDIPKDEVEEALVMEELNGEDLVAYAGYEVTGDETSCMLSDLVVPPAVEVDPAEHFTNDAWTWLVTVGGGITDNRMVSFVCPVEGSDATFVALRDDSTTLSFTAELEALDAFDIAAPSAFAVEWSGLTRHANGNDIDLDVLDQLMIARYDLDVPDIEADFIDLETIAAELYTLDVYGVTSADLTDAVDAQGTAFSGMAAGERWLLALRCTECTNPAPPFLTVIEVE